MTKKILSLLEFNSLPENLQLQLLQKDGVHVGKRIVNGQIVILFQLATFYVEVFYQKYRRDVSRVITSDSADILTPYLDQIHIRDLDKDKGKQE